jgi:DNA-binding IclR family transcriptional regulator
MPSHTESTITDAETYLNEVRKVREHGYAIDNLENEPGVRCVAAPIYDYRKKIIASISLSGISSAITLDTIENNYKHLVMETTEKISRELGFRR